MVTGVYWYLILFWSSIWDRIAWKAVSPSLYCILYQNLCAGTDKSDMLKIWMTMVKLMNYIWCGNSLSHDIYWSFERMQWQILKILQTLWMWYGWGEEIYRDNLPNCILKFEIFLLRYVRSPFFSDIVSPSWCVVYSFYVISWLNCMKWTWTPWTGKRKTNMWEDTEYPKIKLILNLSYATNLGWFDPMGKIDWFLENNEHDLPKMKQNL